MKYFKLVYGFNDDINYFPITSDELHKANVIAMEGGKTVFENGFFNNRGNDVLRIVPDWHREKGWNRGHKMEVDDFEEVRPLEDSYNKTLSNAKLLAEYIIRENRRDLLSKPASEAFKEVKQLMPNNNKQIFNESKLLADKLKI